MIMKYLISGLIGLVMSGQVYSADWTPLFAHLEQGKKGDGGKMLDKITSQVAKEVFESHDKYAQPVAFAPLASAKKGDYRKVPMPYQQDLLPAKQMDEFTVVAPLKNATLYGYPIKSLTEQADGQYFSGTHYFNFGKLSDAQYNQLVKKHKFKTRCNNGKPNGVWDSYSFKV